MPTSTRTSLAVGDIKLILLKRGQRLAIRIKDNRSPIPRRVRRPPAGTPSARTGGFRRSSSLIPTPTKLVMDTIVGESEVEESPGYVTFEREGKTYRLQAAKLKNGGLWFVFRDRPAGGPPTAAPGSSRPILRRAMSSSSTSTRRSTCPCAYIPYATCPLAPPRTGWAWRSRPASSSTNPIDRPAIRADEPRIHARFGPSPRAGVRESGDRATGGPPWLSSSRTGTGKASRRTRPGSRRTGGVVEEVEVRGHIVDSLLLPKILDRILLMGGIVRDPRVQDRRAAVGPELRADRDPGRRPRDAPGDPGRPGRARRLARASGGRQVVPGRHRRRVPRGFLQHDQPADAGPHARPLGRRRRTRRWTAASSSIRATGTAAMHPDDPRRGGHADRRRPRGRARAADRAIARGQPVRLHELDGLQREAEVGEHPGRGRRDPGDPRGRARRS